MKVNLILTFIILISSPGFLNKGGKNNHTYIPIKSIDPNESDFSDLQPLKKIIGDKRIVLLGEQNHGDGSSMLARTRLVKFLHEEMGFDVLAMETSLFTGKSLQRSKMKKDSSQYWNNIRFGIMKVWAHSEECWELWNYLWREDSLIFAGFDSQLEDDYARGHFIEEFKNFLSQSGINTNKYQELLKTFRVIIDYRYSIDPKPVSDREISNFKTGIDSLLNDLEDKFQNNTDDKEFMFYRNWLVNAREQQIRSKWKKQQHARDSLMFHNLVWLCEKYYPEKKIIGWGATRHFIKNPDRIDTQMDDFQYGNGYTTAGDLLFKKYGNGVHIIGTTEFNGVTSRGPWPKGMGWKLDSLPDSSAGSLEAKIHDEDLDFAFVNLHSFSEIEYNNEPYVSRTIGTVEMKAKWQDHLDGIIYVDEMKPNTRNAFWHGK